MNPSPKTTTATRIAGASVAIIIVATSTLFVPFGSTSAFGVAYGPAQKIDLREDLSGVESLIMTASSTDVTVTGDPHTTEPHVLVGGTAQGITPEVKVRRVNGQHIVSVKCKSWGFFGARCAVHANVIVPTHTDLTVRTSSGDIAVHKINAAITARASSGDVELNDVDAAVIARTSSGNVDLHNITGDIRARASSGNITIEYPGAATTVEALTASGNVSMQSPEAVPTTTQLAASSGNIVIDLPRTADVAIDATAISGQVINQLPHNPQAPHSVKANTNSGNVWINAAQ